jgi:hypothetical protein
MFLCEQGRTRGRKLWLGRWCCSRGKPDDQALACAPVAGVEGRKLVWLGGGCCCGTVGFGAYLSVI